MKLEHSAATSMGTGRHTHNVFHAIKPVTVEEERKNDLPQDITFCGYARHYFKKAPILGVMRSLPCL
jgi:Na+-driven multidrug efflux pump